MKRSGRITSKTPNVEGVDKRPKVYYANVRSIPLDLLTDPAHYLGQFRIVAEGVAVQLWFDHFYGVLVLRKGLEEHKRLSGQRAALAGREIELNAREGHYHWELKIEGPYNRLTAMVKSYGLGVRDEQK